MFSKIGIMFLISAIQTVFYVLVGNFILGIHGLFFAHWMILFSTSCFANLLGLNISASFNSVKVIYILIPICIIPQLLFSGIIVPFDKLHPYFSSKSEVPAIGNIMASRWAYEALTVVQFKDNDYEKRFFEFDKKMSFANWKKDQWESNLDSKLTNFYRISQKENPLHTEIDKIKRDGQIIINEVRKEIKNFNSSDLYSDEDVEKLLLSIKNNNMEKKDYLALHNYLTSIRDYYMKQYNTASNLKDEILIRETDPDTTFIRKLRALKKQKVISSKEYRSFKNLMSYLKKYQFQKFKNNYNNHSLEDFVTNSNSLTYITEDETGLIQKADPIYLDPVNHKYFGAHFYAPSKYFLDYKFDTFSANLIVIWLMTLVLTITLYFDVLRKILEMKSSKR